MKQEEARELAQRFGVRMCDENGMTHGEELYCLGLDDIIAMKKALAKQEQRCEYCDGTGDVHDQTGEWRGVCVCEAGAKQEQGEPLPDFYITEKMADSIYKLKSPDWALCISGNKHPTMHKNIPVFVGYVKTKPVKQEQGEPSALEKTYSLLLWDYQELERAFNKITSGTWIRKSNTSEKNT